MSVNMRGGITLYGFKVYYPNMHDQIEDYYVSGPLEITVRLKDGRVIRYDELYHTISIVNYTRDNITQTEWRRLFGFRLKKLMYILGITQEELSEMADISCRSISKYINGQAEPCAFTLFKICTALDCNVDDLVGVWGFNVA